MRLYAKSDISGLCEKYGVRLSKSLGQNFLTDSDVRDAIIDSSMIGTDDLVIEIGPGIGVLTAAAAEKARRVAAVEIDHRLLPILKETLADYDNIEIINADILKTDVNAIIEAAGCAHVRIIGNLPYYITTPILMKLLEDGVKADSITVMMQLEVAERIKAAAGDKARGALSVAVQYYCSVADVTRVPRTRFFPQPQVDSAVLRLDLLAQHPVTLTDEALFFACVKAGFGQRRKTLLNSLTGMNRISRQEAAAILEAAAIDPVRRAETLSMEEFARIANAAAALQQP